MRRYMRATPRQLTRLSARKARQGGNCHRHGRSVGQEDEPYPSAEEPVVYDFTVYDDEPEIVESGILDLDGTPLVRANREPCGFLVDELEGDDEE